MANKIMTREETQQMFRDSTRKTVADMDPATVQKFAARDLFNPGINGAILAFLAIAARERLASEEYAAVYAQNEQMGNFDSKEQNEVAPQAGDRREAVLQVLYDYFEGECGDDEAIDRITALFS